ncbi:MAG: tyrosine-type recombinase/integrase [Lentimicrobiaceae bacterium]|nr:tyrosine-type recombinase/integrase [Lentimicrobiaceae bacterium]
MLLNAFNNYLTYEKRYSEHTVYAYSNDIEAFNKYINDTYEGTDILEVDHQMVRSWVAALVDSEISAISIKRKLSSVRAFYRYCQQKKHIKYNPAAKIVAPKTGETLPTFLTTEQTTKLLDLLPKADNYIDSRDRIIVTLLYATGIRRAELKNLKTTDISFDKKTITVVGKRNKQRIIPIGENLISELNNYIEQRRKFVSQLPNFCENDSLLLTIKGKPIYDKAIHNVVHSQLTKVATNSKLSPHVLRHTFATQLLNDDADINAIKELLGHSSLAATQIYTHNTIDKLKSIHKQAHPRA